MPVPPLSNGECFVVLERRGRERREGGREGGILEEELQCVCVRGREGER